MSLSSSSNAYNMPWMICSMVELTVQQVEKLREMSPLYEFVKEVLHVSDVYEEERHALAVWHTALFMMSSFALEIASGISKMFAQKKVTLSPGRHKIVILDEADRNLIRLAMPKLMEADVPFESPTCPSNTAVDPELNSEDQVLCSVSIAPLRPTTESQLVLPLSTTELT
ncbi:hypothetical protein D0Y65_055448 [Glycine soja]|uniref:Uncharacterized protein n=1 Tax=Glycine soja TaxID=3848 RepID=A0A445EXS2_GLYSO|nr:hypothetical protein D0Y65_055448 [Glycine soja]